MSDKKYRCPGCGVKSILDIDSIKGPHCYCYECEGSWPKKDWHEQIAPQSSPVEFEAGEKFVPEQGDDIEVSLNGKDWMDTPYEFLALNANDDYICWTDNKIVTERWPYGRELKPAEVRPDYLDEGEELWAYDDEQLKGSVLYNHIHNPETCTNFIGFAVESGNGKVHVMQSPHWFTLSEGSLYQERFRDGMYKAECRGAVMLKGSK